MDLSKCPICGEPNLCAIEIAKATGKPQEPCWCVSVDFSADVLSKVPSNAQNKACICSKCVTQ
ncbi:MAG: cysteine-rich CWC family protein [Limnohabitans sp.]